MTFGLKLGSVLTKTGQHFYKTWVVPSWASNRFFYENALQVLHSSKNYMLMQSHPSLNATKHLWVLKNIMVNISVTEKCPMSIVFTLKVKSVMDGKCSKMTGPKDTSGDRIINKKACYIIFEKGHEKDRSRLMAFSLKTKKYAEHCRMGISLIPKYNQFASNTICCKVLGNIKCHYKIQVNLQHCILETMVNIDKYNETPKSTGHQLLMKMMRPSNLVTLALLAVNTKEWGGDGIVLTFPKSYKDISKDACPLHPRHVVSHLWWGSFLLDVSRHDRGCQRSCVGWHHQPLYFDWRTAGKCCNEWRMSSMGHAWDRECCTDQPGKAVAGAWHDPATGACWHWPWKQSKFHIWNRKLDNCLPSGRWQNHIWIPLFKQKLLLPLIKAPRWVLTLLHLLSMPSACSPQRISTIYYTLLNKWTFLLKWLILLVPRPRRRMAREWWLGSGQFTMLTRAAVTLYEQEHCPFKKQPTDYAEWSQSS